MPRIYFDHAATSWPRLPGVVAAMSDFENQHSAAAGRGAYRSSISIDQTLQRLRVAIAKLVNAASPAEVAFFANGTLANNYALAGLLKPGDHVVTTAAEHNSILRPLALMKQSRGVDFTIVRVDQVGRVSPTDMEAAIRPETRLFCVCSASNVTGALQNLSAIGELAKRYNVRLMIDAAQSLGYRPLDMQQLSIDVLTFPGHKGGGGPLGTAALIASQELHPNWSPLWIGGTGEQSDLLSGDFDWQRVAESGNRNSAALVGWLAGLETLLADKAHSDLLAANYSRLLNLLGTSSLGTVLGHDDEQFVPVISLRCGEEMMPSDWAAILDASFGIEVRAGYHCAAAIHEALQTAEGGTLRFSIGHTTTAEDLDALEAALAQLSQA